MKKLMLMTLLALFCAQATMAQRATDVFNDFRDVRHVESTTIPKALVRIGAGQVKDGNVKEVMRGVDRMQILDMDDCSKRNRKKFISRINELEKYGYEEYGRMSGNNDNMLILTRSDKDKNMVREIVLLMTDKDDCTGILVEGNINPEDIEAIAGSVMDD
ncbi:MAG: DUF4252 domain-containing protein [Prevotella sp.]|jgi:hypothetical protein